MTIFLLSLAGIPPTAGFFGKLILFQCAIKAGYVGLAVLGLLASVVGVCYYLKVASEIWMKPAEKEFGRLSLSPLSIFAVGLSALVTVLGVVEYFGIMAVIDRFTGIS
jgi:NADH-quinone oxidoreductase subunit N